MDTPQLGDVETSQEPTMHAYKLSDAAALRRSRNLLVFQNLPDLPPPRAKLRWHLHAWLGVLAACFLIVSLTLGVLALWQRIGP